MRTLNKNKQTVYLCQHYESNGRILYKNPIEIEASINTISNKWAVANIGPVTKDAKTLICDEEDAELFSLNDKVYLNNQPVMDDLLAENADYKVVSIESSLNVLNIIIKKVIGNEE